VLQMRGDYLAIVTLGFGEIVRLIALSDWLKPFIGGSNGITLIPKPTLGPIRIDTPQVLLFAPNRDSDCRAYCGPAQGLAWVGTGWRSRG
jgi:branched-chain amino acid transport system permease protein